MKRTNNEDAIYVNEQKNLYVVADGMGGCNAGEVASNTAISIFVEAMEKTENEEKKRTKKSIFFRRVV